MTIQEILANEELRQHEFPVTAKQVFLGHAGVSPLPHRVTEAMTSYLAACNTLDQETAMHRLLLAETRAAAARLLSCAPGEIALVGPTSLALSMVAGGLRFKRRGNVLVYLEDFPSNVYPWMTLADRGMEVRFLNIPKLGQLRQRDIEGQIDEDTRLVAISSCHYITGFRVDVPAIGALLRKRGILFSLDAIQTLGAFPMNAANVDFIAACSHKWLLGPCAAGLMYVRREAQDILEPVVQGWHNVKSPDYVTQEELDYRDDARRYEAGTPNIVGIAGMKASLELLLEIGVENIATELLRKRQWVTKALQEKGMTVLGADAPEVNWSGMITFQKPGEDMTAKHQKLTSAGIFTSLRSDRAGKKYIRLSPHFYNTDAELHRALELV